MCVRHCIGTIFDIIINSCLCLLKVKIKLKSAKSEIENKLNTHHQYYTYYHQGQYLSCDLNCFIFKSVSGLLKGGFYQ